MDRIPCDCQAFKIQCPKSWALFTSISSLIPAPKSSGSFKIPVAQRPSLTDSHLTGCGRAQSLVFFSPNYPSLVIGTLKFRRTQVESHAFPGIPNTAKPSCPSLLPTAGRTTEGFPITMLPTSRPLHMLLCQEPMTPVWTQRDPFQSAGRSLDVTSSGKPF